MQTFARSGTARALASTALVVCTGRTELVRSIIKPRLEDAQIIEVADPADLLAGPRIHPAAILLAVDADNPSATLQMARQLRERHPRAATIVVTPHGSEALAVAALRAGATNYFAIPSDADALVEELRRVTMAAPAGAESDHADSTRAGRAAPPLIGETAQMRELRDYVSRVASNEFSVVITGETGTGKEVVAERLHAQSARHRGPFVPVNCAAIPDALVESELFGYERGAFTGAVASRGGHLEQAHRGTIFFDEIGDMGAHAQAKMLRAIERGEVVRLGGRRAIPVDIRVVAATNQDLELAMNEGRFRKDLYFRLNVARIHIPPLRERRADIPRLLDYYGSRLRPRGAPDGAFTPEAIEVLTRYDWPGNVRELKNLVEIVMSNIGGGVIGVAQLPETFRRSIARSAGGTERQRLLEVLAETNWNKSKAAQKLHWSRMTLYRKLAKYHILVSTDIE